MSGVLRRVLVVVAAFAAVAPPAVAGPASAEARARAETAFLDGRLDDLDAALGAGTTATDLEPLALRDGWWRPRGDGIGNLLARISPDDPSLSARRIRWCADRDAQRATPFPAPRPGEVDAYPRLALLVLDRARRERLGADGLPEAGPLWDADDEALRYVWRWYAVRAYRGPDLASMSAEDRAATEAAQRRFEDVVARNRVGAVGAVLGLVLAAGLVRRALGRWRKNAPGSTDP